MCNFLRRRTLAARHILSNLHAWWFYLTFRPAAGRRVLRAFARKVEHQRRQEAFRGRPTIVCAWHPLHFPGTHTHIIRQGNPKMDTSHGICPECKAAEMAQLTLSAPHARN